MTVFMFPGQGSQYLGMGKELYSKFSIVKILFEEINDTIGYDLSKIIFDEYSDKINNTEYTQPAIMAVSIATIKVMEYISEKKIYEIAKYVMGHSLGEYSALCSIGALSVPNTAMLLKIRGQAMQKAIPLGEGTMIALLGIDIHTAEELTDQISDCYVANDNGGGQIVLSCLVDKLAQIKHLAKSMGVKKSVQLPVSAPFHSHFMQPAAEEMKELLKSIKIPTLTTPLIANVTACEVVEGDQIIEYLIRQVVERVRWRESVLYCSTKKTKNYIEIGPGKVLTNLVKRICTDSPNLFNICNSDQINHFLNEYNHK